MSTRTIVADFLDGLSAAAASALLLDYDGTLAPFHTQRDRAYPYPGVVPLLDSILRSGRMKVAIISGRPVREVQSLLNPLHDIEIWGAHGLEHLSADGTYRQIAIEPKVAAILMQAERELTEDGLSSRLESKPGGIAVHWRGLQDAEIESIEARVSQKWAAFADQPGVKLLSFDGGLELRATHPDKGDAIAAILKNLDPESPVAFLGDDVTDEDAFRMLNGRGLTVLVRDELRETSAAAWLRPPEELTGFFEQWLKRVSG